MKMEKTQPLYLTFKASNLEQKYISNANRFLQFNHCQQYFVNYLFLTKLF